MSSALVSRTSKTIPSRTPSELPRLTASSRRFRILATRPSIGARLDIFALRRFLERPNLVWNYVAPVFDCVGCRSQLTGHDDLQRVEDEFHLLKRDLTRVILRLIG